MLDNVHPNIVGCHGMSYDFAGNLHIMTEYSSKGDVLNFIENKFSDKRFDSDRDRKRYVIMFKILTDLLIGLMYLHEKKIAHRDLKPDNLLVFGDWDHPVVKICDMGCAKNVGDSEAKTEVGTRRFMAPEMLSSDKYDALRADIFSLGVLIFYICMRKMPWDNDK
jgi:serine/threonine protein kinase